MSTDFIPCEGFEAHTARVREAAAEASDPGPMDLDPDLAAVSASRTEASLALVISAVARAREAPAPSGALPERSRCESGPGWCESLDIREATDCGDEGEEDMSGEVGIEERMGAQDSG